MADNIGLKQSWLAYKIFQSENDVQLPGLKGFSNDQLFFLAYANVSAHLYVYCAVTAINGCGFNVLVLRYCLDDRSWKRVLKRQRELIYVTNKILREQRTRIITLNACAKIKVTISSWSIRFCPLFRFLSCYPDKHLSGRFLSCILKSGPY